MSQEKTFYTFIVAPSAKGRFHKLNIKYSYIYAGVGTLLSVIIIFSLCCIWVARHAADVVAFNQLKKDNLELTSKHLADQNKIEKLSARVNNIEDQAKKLSTSNGLQYAEDIDTNIGRGGPDSFDVVEKNAEHLEDQLRVINFELDNRRLMMSTTPKGFPVQGYLTDHFGLRRFAGSTEFHPGLDIAVPSGTGVAATADGLVIYAAWRNGYGNAVVIDHGGGITTRYGHLSALEVTAGQQIHRGDVIGRAGSTGRSTGPHVHYEVRENNVPLDPMKFAANQ
ncbi:MAG TPA: M23 family metallopeptidase [Blastocatellia bacterium]|nr:M23 family metallopeptidase [Blastocatellia bacterium]